MIQPIYHLLPVLFISQIPSSIKKEEDSKKRTKRESPKRSSKEVLTRKEPVNSRKTSETRKGLPTTGIPTVGHPPALTELNLRTRKKPEQWNCPRLRETK